MGAPTKPNKETWSIKEMAPNQELTGQGKKLNSARNDLGEKNEPRVLNRSLLLVPEILVSNLLKI